jgi:hypothetical protein
MISRRAWTIALAGLAAVRVAIPLVVLAAEGRGLRVLPRYEHEPLIGDATGFYATSRELISAAAGPVGAIVVLISGAGFWLALQLRESWQRVVAAAATLSLAATVLVLASKPAGAAVVGWPLLWAALLLPFRLLGVLNADVAFAVGLPVLLAANAVTVVATAYLGLRLTGSRAVGLAAAALFVLWPFAVRPLAGDRAWENGQWLVDVGLALYNEPLSTALVAVALSLLLARRPEPTGLALAGFLLGFATTVRISNGFIAALAAALVVQRLGPRRSMPLLAAGLPFTLLVAAYWPKGYPAIPDVPGFSLEQAGRSWSDSSIFDPLTVLVLLPFAVLGVAQLRTWGAVLLTGVVAVTAAFYTFYEHTHLHPRFLYVTLPALFALDAAGAWLVIRKVSRDPPEPGL